MLAPHPDDGEFGCGGTLKKMREDGHQIWYAAFSPCHISLPEDLAPGTLYQELPKALAHLGIPPSHIITFQYPVRDFPANRQLILEDLIKLRKQISPDLVLMPNSTDVHQDHHTIYEEGLRAFKNSRLLCICTLHSSIGFTTLPHIV